MSDTKCDECGKVYNEYLGDRFWSGSWIVDGRVFNTLCDDCHRELVRS